MPDAGSEEVGSSARPSSSGSSTGQDLQQQPGSGRKSFTVSNTYKSKHTLGAVYGGDDVKFEPIDHLSRRKERDIKDIAESARRLGLTEDKVRENLSQLQFLLPGLTPNLHKMKASEWAQVLASVPTTTSAILAFKSLYPGVDLLKVVATSPRLLLKDPHQMQGDAAQVRQVLQGLADEEVQAILEAVPYLCDPRQLVQGLSNLAAWFPSQDPIEMLKRDPTKLVNVEEADLEADPLYGEITCAG